jgi:hypothetical protein
MKGRRDERPQFPRVLADAAGVRQPDVHEPLKIERRANFRASSEKLNLTKHLVGFWRDLEDNQCNSRVLDQGHFPVHVFTLPEYVSLVETRWRGVMLTVARG